MSARSSLVLPLVVILGSFAPDAAAQCERQKVFGSDSKPFDNFGNALAASGDCVIIGAVFHDGAAGDNTGKAYIHELQNGDWVQSAILEPSDVEAADRFAFSVDIENDIAVVGSRYDDPVGYGSGSAYVFERVNGSWVETAKLRASDESQGDLYGNGVAVSGNTLLISTLGGAHMGVQCGTAYFYERVGNSWVEQKVWPSDFLTGGNKAFGSYVALDGDTAVIGARIDSGTGAAYVFERGPTGWTEVARLTAFDAASGDFYGASVALDGETIVVGAVRADALGPDSGAAYVYRRISGQWTFSAKLLPNDGVFEDSFGANVAVSGDDTVLVGAWGADQVADAAGAAYVFRFNGAQWVQSAKLVPGDGTTQDNFGYGVALAGSRPYVGSRGALDAGGSSVGAVYAYASLDAMQKVGNGCVGSGGFTPTLIFYGCPVSSGFLQINVGKSLGAAQALLLIGDQPANTVVWNPCRIYLLPLAEVWTPLLGTGPGAGWLRIEADLPVVAPGTTFYSQVFVVDPGVSRGFANTNAVRITID